MQTVTVNSPLPYLRYIWSVFVFAGSSLGVMANARSEYPTSIYFGTVVGHN